MKIITLVEARSVTGPIKPLLQLAAIESSANKAQQSWQRICVTTTRNPDLGITHTNPLLDAAKKAALPIILIREKRLFDFSVIRQLGSILADQQPDIVETHDFKSHLLLLLCKQVMRHQKSFRWIAFHHGYTRMSWRVYFYQQLDRISLRYANTVITLCKPFVSILQRRGVRADRIRVITNCIEPSPPPHTVTLHKLRQELAIHDEMILLVVGRLSPEKGHADLFAALSILLRDSPSLLWRLLVVGDGGEHERLQRLATPLENRITFVGHQTDTWPYYFLADMFVLSSLSEGSPLVILEAMAAGLPIVATTVGGVPELLTDNKTALLTPPADPQALARALALLLMNPALRQSLGAAAQSASESHTPLKYATALHALYADPL